MVITRVFEINLSLPGLNSGQKKKDNIMLMQLFENFKDHLVDKIKGTRVCNMLFLYRYLEFRQVSL